MPSILPRLAITMLPLLLCGCAITPAAGITVRDGARVDLMPGQSARLDDATTIHYARLVSDSRCRPDVQCVWAGDAQIALEWHAGSGAPRPINLHTNTGVGPDRARLGVREITLLDLARDDPRATLQVRLIH